MGGMAQTEIRDTFGSWSPKNRFRQRRVEVLAAMVADYARSGTCRIIDLGGTSDFWETWAEHFDWNRVSVTCVNLDPGPPSTLVELRTADATNLHDLADGAFDVAFSNSVIEHVGRKNMAAFARETRRLGRSYYVQTPNFWFPIELHARFPFLHWMPDPIAARIVMARKCGFWEKAATYDEAIGILRSAELLTMRDMRSFFPDARIERERLMGFTKSLIAIRHPD